LLRWATFAVQVKRWCSGGIRF